MNKSVAAAAAIVVLLGLWMLSGLIPSNSETDNTSADSGSTTANDGNEPTGSAGSGNTGELMRVQIEPAAANSMDREITLQGQLNPIRQLVIKAQTSGVVETLPISKGSRVELDTMLVQLSLEGRDAQLRDLNAQLQSARSEQKAARRLTRQGLQSQLALEQATARLASAQSAVTRLNIEVKNIQILAPFDGILNQLSVEQGQLIERGTEVGELVDDSAFVVRANAAQQTISQIKVGQPVTARLITGEELPGKITYLSAVADNTTRSFAIEAEVTNPGGALAGGVSASLVVPVEKIEAVLISPSTLALGDNGEMGVKIANDEDMVEFYPVSLISTDSLGAWVTGVPANARIITLGQGFVNIGDKVDPVEAPDS